MTYAKPARYSHGALTATPDGVFSYATCLLTHLDDGSLVYNDTNYSPTTSKHQSQVRQQYIPSEATVIILNDVPRGCSAKGLRALAYVMRTDPAEYAGPFGMTASEVNAR